MVISHNLMAMNAQRQYGLVTKRRAGTTEKLSSGYRVNRAADDAAGLAISEKMRRQIRGLNQGADNIQDGVGLLQIADGALAEVDDMLHRMTELAIKAANGTLQDDDRQAIQEEIANLKLEIDRIGKTTTFNEMPVFDDMFGEEAESITELVKSATAETGYLTESYAKGGSYYASANLDFSTIHSGNISYLYDKTFSFNCSESCSEVFEFTLKNGGGNSAVNLGARQHHKYTIDIGGMTKGSQIVDAIYSYVSANLPTMPAGVTGIPGDLLVSHSNSLAKDGAMLHIYASSSPASSKAAAESMYPKAYDAGSGVVDISEISGTVEASMVNEIPIRCSAQDGDVLTIGVERMNAKLLGVDDVDVRTVSGAERAIDKVKGAVSEISRRRSDIGAYQNRLEHAYNNNRNIAENTQAAESRIRDTDMAALMVEYSKDNILAQAGEAMLAQANQTPQGVMNLLQ